uniref:hypothetical protein n=1 Tax=Herbidospora sakaeratensis TaxID=564415 RepID=UPI0007836771|nr:hypothetical protein [Herbidospora sakaeratensis]
MSRRWSRLFAAVALGAAVVVPLAPAQVAYGGVFDGDVTNRLPSSYTVKVATFTPPNLPETCVLNTGESVRCRTYWLPSGRADDQINGTNWDTDALMVESNYRLYKINGSYINIPAFRWYKILSGDNRTCELTSNVPACFPR